MLKKLKKILCFAFIFILLSEPLNVNAEGYTKPNGILTSSGQEKTNQIKKFQAQYNLTVTGVLDNRTKEMLYNEDFIAYDKVENEPSKGYWIVINKTKRILTVYKGKDPIYKFPVTLGKSSTPTPSAKAKITNKAKNPAWGGMGGKYEPVAADDPKNPLGERWMGLYIPGESGYGIHGNIRPREIGKYTSNGCIRMFNYDIETYVYPIMKSGDPVWIGTDEELANFGIYQYADYASNNIVAKPENNDVTVEETQDETKNPYTEENKESVVEKGTDYFYDNIISDINQF